MAKADRTSAGLRNVLFSELEELRAGTGDPTRALAVARLAQQIVSVARTEMEFQRMITNAMEKGHAIPPMGTMPLGTSPAASVKDHTKDK